ncbi:unnamed protein product [Calypogeia fissa]
MATQQLDLTHDVDGCLGKDILGRLEGIVNLFTNDGPVNAKFIRRVENFDFRALFVSEGKLVAVKEVLHSLEDTFCYYFKGVGAEFMSEVVYHAAILGEPIKRILEMLHSSGDKRKFL